MREGLIYGLGTPRIKCRCIGCTKYAKSGGLCTTHYRRYLKGKGCGGPIRKWTKALPIAIALVATSKANLPVIDASHIAVSTGNEIVNFLKWAKTETDAAATELHTLQSYENSIVQLARMGNPAALKSLPGISTVAELYGTGQQLMYDYRQWQGLLDPKRYQYDLNSILSSYQLPNWQGYMGQGYQIYPNQGSYQWDTARWNVANSAQEGLQKLEQQRERLQQQRDTVLAQLQNATDQSQVQKYTGILQGLNGAIAEIGAHETGILGQVRLKEQQILSGQNVYQRRSMEQQQASDWQTLESMELGRLPLGGWNQPMMWRGR